MRGRIICITPVKHLEGVYERLEQYENFFYEPNITKDELSKRLSSWEDIEYLFTNPNKQNFVLDEEVLGNSNIKVINTCSTGLNHIDMDYCERNNIEVLSLKEDFELINELPSTAELSFGLMMSLLRKIPEGFNSVKKGEWDYEPFIGRQVKGLTIGIIGYGRLGKILVKLLSGWGVKILVNDPYVEVDDENCIRTTMNELWKQSDVVFLHLHVTDITRTMVGDYFLSNMKRGSVLINTSR